MSKNALHVAAANPGFAAISSQLRLAACSMSGLFAHEMSKSSGGARSLRGGVAASQEMAPGTREWQRLAGL
jgi:hypothetical protein